jgi:hypothetical protein
MTKLFFGFFYNNKAPIENKRLIILASTDVHSWGWRSKNLQFYPSLFPFFASIIILQFLAENVYGELQQCQALALT